MKNPQKSNSAFYSLFTIIIVLTSGMIMGLAKSTNWQNSPSTNPDERLLHLESSSIKTKNEKIEKYKLILTSCGKTPEIILATEKEFKKNKNLFKIKNNEENNIWIKLEENPILPVSFHTNKEKTHLILHASNAVKTEIVQNLEQKNKIIFAINNSQNNSNTVIEFQTKYFKETREETKLRYCKPPAIAMKKMPAGLKQNRIGN